MRFELNKSMAYAAGMDAGNRNMRKEGRKVWNEKDWNVASKITNDLLDKIEKEVKDGN